MEKIISVEDLAYAYPGVDDQSGVQVFEDLNLQVEQGSFVCSGTITHLDVSTIVGKFPERAKSLMDQKIAAAENLTEIYDEQNNFRQELVEQVLQEALQQTLAQDGETVTREVSLKLVNRDGRWWVIPHQNLLQILTGLA